METKKVSQVNICQTVPISSHEGFSLDVPLDLFNPSPGIGLHPGIHKGYPPVTTAFKIFPNSFPQMAEAEDKIIEAIVRVYLHNMMEYGFLADFDERLGSKSGMGIESGSPSPA